MATKKQLEAQMKKARRALWEIEKAEAAEKAKAFVGKCFTYRNCYSCPSGPSDYWMLFVRIDGCDKEGSLIGVVFDTDKYGNVQINSRVPMVQSLVPGGGYTPCSRETLDAAFADLACRIGLVAKGGKFKQSHP